jgi:hypothetical protein
MMDSTTGRARPLVALGYGPRCVPVMQLAEAAAGLCDLLWMIDTAVPGVRWPNSSTGSGLERFDLGVVVGRPQMLNLAGTAPRRPHDLHRNRPRSGLHDAYVSHQRTLRAQI